jgi:hypothetical protein
VYLRSISMMSRFSNSKFSFVFLSDTVDDVNIISLKAFYSILNVL